MSVQKVNFLLMNHGAYENDELTEKGQDSVVSAASQFLPQLQPIDVVMASDSPQAEQTVRLAADTVGVAHSQIYRSKFFGITWTEEDGIEHIFPFKKMLNRVKEAKEAQHPLTVSDLWLKGFYPPALAFRRQLITAMYHLAVRVIGNKKFNQDVFTFLIGTHSISTYAFLDPTKANPAPPPCSIAVYEWQLENGLPALTTSYLLPLSMIE